MVGRKTFSQRMGRSAISTGERKRTKASMIAVWIDPELMGWKLVYWQASERSAAVILGVLDQNLWRPAVSWPGR